VSASGGLADNDKPAGLAAVGFLGGVLGHPLADEAEVVPFSQVTLIRKKI